MGLNAQFNTKRRGVIDILLAFIGKEKTAFKMVIYKIYK